MSERKELLQERIARIEAQGQILKMQYDNAMKELQEIQQTERLLEGKPAGGVIETDNPQEITKE